MEDLESKAEASTLSPSECILRQNLIIGIKDIERKNILDLKQKSRIKWAIEGDENSRFFHGIINSNRRNNFIHGVPLNGV